MGHLLSYYKEAGRHLDPKTRFLISVLKQVVEGSPRGLKQYIRRAREAGASRDEIIDTILLAYPLANLTRMSDAADVLLEMEAEEGTAPASAPPSARPDDAPAKTAEAASGRAWHVVSADRVPAEGACSHVVFGETVVLLIRRNGRVFAMDDRCPHRGGYLHSGTYSAAEGAVVCPLHGWSFRLEDGASAGRGLGGGKVFAIRETGGRVEVEF
jgi:nitrite reductase/ring-hydroxylating ferredoxin subunit